MIKIYVWLPDGNNVGHTAMQVRGTYISFWPEGGASAKDLKLKRSQPGAYADELKSDIDSEGGREPIVIELTNLDEYAILKYFAEISQNKPRYQILRNNCSHMIAHCLMAGGNVQPSFVPHAGHYSNLARRLTIGVWTPDQILKFAEELKLL